MGFRGDLVHPPHGIVGKFIEIPMATATTRTYIHPKGFVVATDGRMRDSDSKTTITDEAQKIFDFGEIKSLAYSFTGQIHLMTEHSKRVVFDFISRMREAVEYNSPDAYRTLHDYALALSRPIWRSLEQERLTKNIKLPVEPSVYPGERGCSIATIQIDGYHKGWPSRVNMRFYCEDQQLAQPDVRERDLDDGKHLLSGFPKIGELLDAQDPRFVQYLKPIDKSLSESEALLYAIWFSRAYIEACSGPEALAMNEEICSGIGGHPQIATITPKDGFQWVEGFKPKGAK